jgi:hypothetical protein
MQVAILTQEDFIEFNKRVAVLKEAGVELDYTVAKPNHKKVKVTMLTPIEEAKWDAIYEGVAQ